MQGINLINLIKTESYLSMNDMGITLFNISESKLDFINDLICSYFNKPNDFLKTKGKSVEEKVLGRQLFAYLTKKHLNTKYPHMAFYFDYRSHQTFIHSKKKIANKLKKTGPSMIKEIILSLEDKLGNIKKYE